MLRPRFPEVIRVAEPLGIPAWNTQATFWAASAASDAVRLQELVARASEGEQIVIAQNEHPLAKLVPFADVEDDRTFGQACGRIHVSDDFDEPLPDDFWLGHRQK